MKFNYLSFFLIFGLSSCSFGKMPDIDVLPDLFSDESEEKIIRPENSIEYNCENKKTFFLVFLNKKKSVWLILPNREFKLNNIEEFQNIYTNDITTLEIASENTQIKNEKEILYSQCTEKKDAEES